MGNIDNYLDNQDYTSLGRLLLENPGKIRKLYSRLHETNETKLNKTLDGFQIAAKVMKKEKLLDIIRRLMWMLNEESGNNCPNAALALGHIAQVNPDLVQPHMQVLSIYANDPSEQLHKPVRKALSMIHMAMMKHKKKGEE